jgi:acyl-CoA thioesterase
METSANGSSPEARFDFDRDTAVNPTGDGLYEGLVTDRWQGLGGLVNGGYLLALSVNALLDVVPHPDPLVVSGTFLRPGATGPTKISTQLVRAGRRLSTAEAALVQNDKEVVRTIATFAEVGGEGRTVMFGAPPELPPPDECVDPMGSVSLPGLTIADRVEFRLRAAPGWMSGTPTNNPVYDFWLRFKDGRPPDTTSLVLLVDSAAPAILELGEMTSTTVELTTHIRGRPAPGWLACRHQTRFVSAGYHEEDSEIWDSQGNLVAQARQLALLP